MEKLINQKLIERGFSEKTLLNNRGLIGAVIDEVTEQLKLSVVSNSYSDCCNAVIDTDEQSLDVCTNCGDRI